MTNAAFNESTQDTVTGLKQIVEDDISAFIKGLPDINPLSDAIAYVLNSGGKRIRPVILLSILTDLGMAPGDFSACALSIELIHISTLVHDDLPALDNDDFRRGNKTCHVMFNEATAVLTGDALFAFAIENILAGDLPPKIKLNVARSATKAYREVCYGQQLDLNPENARSGVLEVAKLKTGSLFSAAVSIPFEIAGRGTEFVTPAKELGMNLGLLYQICDDLADHSDSKGLKGREVSSDLRNQKNTFHSASDAKRRELLRETHNKILEFMDVLKTCVKPETEFSALRESLNFLFRPFADLGLKF